MGVVFIGQTPKPQYKDEADQKDDPAEAKPERNVAQDRPPMESPMAADNAARASITQIAIGKTNPPAIRRSIVLEQTGLRLTTSSFTRPVTASKHATTGRGFTGMPNSPQFCGRKGRLSRSGAKTRRGDRGEVQSPQHQRCDRYQPAASPQEDAHRGPTKG